MWLLRQYSQQRTQYVVFAGLTNKCLGCIMYSSELIVKNKFILLIKDWRENLGRQIFDFRRLYKKNLWERCLVSQNSGKASGHLFE